MSLDRRYVSGISQDIQSVQASKNLAFKSSSRVYGVALRRLIERLRRDHCGT